MFPLGFLTSTAENLFKTLLEMLTQTVSVAAAGDVSREDRIRGIIEDLIDKLPEEFNMQELYSKVTKFFIHHINNIFDRLECLCTFGQTFWAYFIINAEIVFNYF